MSSDPVLIWTRMRSVMIMSALDVPHDHSVAPQMPVNLAEAHFGMSLRLVTILSATRCRCWSS